MAQASFTHTNGSVTFSRAFQRPERSFALLQAARKTAAGFPRGYHYIILNSLITIKLRMNQSERDSFLQFWSTTVNGMVNAFTYTATDGVTNQVRFNTSELPDITETAYGSFTVTVVLRVQ